MCRIGVTLPVSRSTSTTETWLPKGKVEPGGLKSTPAASVSPRAADVARAPTTGSLAPARRRRRGVPRRSRRHQRDRPPKARRRAHDPCPRPVLPRRKSRNHRVAVNESRPCHRHGDLGGVGLDELDGLERDTEAVRNDHRERRRVTLARPGRADSYRRRAVGMYLDGSELSTRTTGVISTYELTPIPSCTRSPRSRRAA